MGQQDTKDRILDVAERLFASKGFHNVSLRTITGEAGVNLASVNYYFGSKDALLEAIFERRILPINKIRKEELEKVRERARKEGRPPDVEETLRAFIEPVMKFREMDRCADDFIRLVGRAAIETDEKVKEIFLKMVKPIFALCFETLCEALPDIPREIVFWRLQFVIGAMSHVMCRFGRFGEIIEGIDLEIDADRLISILLPFVSAGMEA